MPSGMRGIFVGYVDKTWRVFIPSLHKIVESGNVRFDESVITKPGGAILADNREYTVEEFKYLIGTQHIDPDDGLQYTVKCIRRYRGNIVVDRVLSCDIGKSRVSVDTLYALDVASYSASQGLITVTTDLKAASKSASTPSRVTDKVTAGSDHPLWQCGQTREVVAPPSSSSKRIRTPSMVLSDVPSTAAALPSLDPPTRGTEHHPVRRSPRLSVNLSILKNLTLLEIYSATSTLPQYFYIPKSHAQAILCDGAQLWIETEESELGSIREAGVIFKCKLPHGKKALPCRWVYALKTDSDNVIVRYKARLVIRGDYQKDGIDYDETFAPVVRWESM